MIHLSGELDWPEVELAKAALPAELQARYHAFPFLHEMGLALAAADLVVSRAGASALGEYPLFGLPAILVPYPYAWRYQKVNADYLARAGRGGAAERRRPGRASWPGRCARLLSDPARLAGMRAASKAAAMPDAARRGSPPSCKAIARPAMMTLTAVFWMYVILFGIIGGFRGWAKELLVIFSVLLAIAIDTVLLTLCGRRCAHHDHRGRA